MKMIRFVIASFVLIFLLLTAISLLLPSNVRISRAVNITANIDSVRPKLENLTQWQQWNEYIKVMPEKNVSPGSIHSKQLIVKLTAVKNAVVETEWRQPLGKPFIGVFNVISNRSITTVQWYFDFRFEWYPWEKFSSIIYDKQVGPQMEQSLINLKKLLESS